MHIATMEEEIIDVNVRLNQAVTEILQNIIRHTHGFEFPEAWTGPLFVGLTWLVAERYYPAFIHLCTSAVVLKREPMVIITSINNFCHTVAMKFS